MLGVFVDRFGRYLGVALGGFWRVFGNTIRRCLGVIEPVKI